MSSPYRGIWKTKQYCRRSKVQMRGLECHGDYASNEAVEKGCTDIVPRPLPGCLVMFSMRLKTLCKQHLSFSLSLSLFLSFFLNCSKCPSQIDETLHPFQAATSLSLPSPSPTTTIHKHHHILHLRQSQFRPWWLRSCMALSFNSHSVHTICASERSFSLQVNMSHVTGI